jgi:hypothetical protein
MKQLPKSGINKTFELGKSDWVGKQRRRMVAINVDFARPV